MSDESNFPANLEEHKELDVEVHPKEQQYLAVSEGHETEVLQRQQEKGEAGKKPSTTPKAIRLATIARLLEKQTTQMDKIGQTIQPLQKQLKLVERRTEFIKQMPSQLKQLQKQVSQIQKEGQKIRLLLSKKNTASTKKKITKSKKTKRKNTKSKK
jgi:CII-binding regulator of phage lambda lysogenization HflD